MQATGSPPPSTFSLPALSLVIGGARSGKSRLAERLITASRRPRTYIATAQAFDDEMRHRIARHITDRGPDWTTIEAPLRLAETLGLCPPDPAILIDCATLWLTNHMLSGSDLAAATAALLDALATCPAPVVIVSNEVGWGIVPENPLARAFRDAQGRLNQSLAAQSTLAIGVMAGLPIILKGTVPGGFL